MNKLFCTLIISLFCLASLPAIADESGSGFWFEAGAASGKDNASWLTVYHDHSFTDSLAVYTVADVESDGFREFYVGPKFKVNEWLEIGIGAGRESIRSELRGSPRRNAFVSIETDKISSYVTYENGGSGPWHKAYVLYKFTESFSAGVMNETFLGRGPRIEYAVTKNVTVWGAMLRNSDEHETTTIAAITFSF